MEKNFLIGSMGAEVVVGGRPIDLHNLYSTKSIRTDAAGATMTLVFQRDHRCEAPQGWCEAPQGLPELVTLACSGNLKISFNDLVEAPVPLREDAVEILYFDEHCEWDAFLDEDLAAARGFEGLHIRFSGGLVLRIRCAVAQVTTA